MVNSSRPSDDEVEQLLLNASLRDELEPYYDESLTCVNVSKLTTTQENDFLASILAWEQAPILSISTWFYPELTLRPVDTLEDGQVHLELWETIRRLHEKRIVLDFTDHLSDRELYNVIYRDILSSREKQIDLPRNFLHWDCSDASKNPEIWLRFYASDTERDNWEEETGLALPPAENPPYRRKMPRRPLV
jgi:hypothetical protein